MPIEFLRDIKLIFGNWVKYRSIVFFLEADRQEQINIAIGEASAMLAIAEARAKGLKIVSQSLHVTDGKNAAALSIAEQYIHAFDKLAKTNNTLILPSNVGDVSNFVAQAMSIYKHVMPQQGTSRNDLNKAVESSRSSDEVFEYFSDKEEADKHRTPKPHSSKTL